jgi:hypothetical protein
VYLKEHHDVDYTWLDVPVDYMTVDDMERFASYLSSNIQAFNTATGYLSSVRTAFSDKGVKIDDGLWTRIRSALGRTYLQTGLEPGDVELDEDGVPMRRSMEPKKATQFTLGQLNAMNTELFSVRNNLRFSC